LQDLIYWSVYHCNCSEKLNKRDKILYVTNKLPSSPKSSQVVIIIKLETLLKNFYINKAD